MNHDSHESSAADTQRLYNDHRRAAQAMAGLILFRDNPATHVPDFNEDSHEGWLRYQMFRLKYELLEADSDGEHDTPQELSLAETMIAISSHLSDLATPGRPLTPERLLEIDPSLLKVVAQMDDDGFSWPDDATVFHDVLPEDFDDYAFGSKLVMAGRAYNNFPAVLSVNPSVPNEDENLISFMTRTKYFQYASKPYLARAHALEPEFMGALQRRMDTIGSAEEWQHSLYRAVTEEHPDPEDKILLRASRMAYQLLINLMRKDDLKTQAKRLLSSSQAEITDAVQELWT